MNTLFDQTTMTATLQRIDKLQATSQPLWGKMTANQMICHISDGFRDVLKIRNTKPVFPFFLMPLVRWMLLKRPLIKNIWTVPPYLQSPKGGGTKPKDFESDRAELKDFIKRFSEYDEHQPFGSHAVLGVISRQQAGLFMWKHLDHHLRQFGV